MYSFSLFCYTPQFSSPCLPFLSLYLFSSVSLTLLSPSFPSPSPSPPPSLPPSPSEVHRPQAPLPVLHHLPGASLCVLSGKTGTREGSVWTDLTSLQEKQKRQGNTWYLPHSYVAVRVSLYFAIGVYVLCTSYTHCVYLVLLTCRSRDVQQQSHDLASC